MINQRIKTFIQIAMVWWNK